jgi:hypothetical protein
MSASSHGRVTLNEATTPNGGGNNNKLRASSVFGLDQNQGKKKTHFSFNFVNRENVGRGLLFIHTAHFESVVCCRLVLGFFFLFFAHFIFILANFILLSPSSCCFG